MVECVKHNLHKLILRSYELLHLWVIVGIAGLVVASLTIAMVVPRVDHLRNFWIRDI
jgi:antibiotic biosynthesis monooxygenase (ABM) superfamily enzyme